MCVCPQRRNANSATIDLNFRLNPGILSRTLSRIFASTSRQVANNPRSSIARSNLIGEERDGGRTEKERVSMSRDTRCGKKKRLGTRKVRAGKGERGRERKLHRIFWTREKSSSCALDHLFIHLSIRGTLFVVAFSFRGQKTPRYATRKRETEREGGEGREGEPRSRSYVCEYV